MTDTERLDWLEKQPGAALVNDDFDHWTVTFDGMQNVPEDPKIANDIVTTFFVKASEWSNSIREAIDKAILDEK